MEWLDYVFLPNLRRTLFVVTLFGIPNGLKAAELWPETGVLSFNQITDGLSATLKQFYEWKRINRRSDLVWRGPQTPEWVKITSHEFSQRLKSTSLLYEESHKLRHRSALDVILGIWIQIGIEEGRRSYLNSEAADVFREKAKMALQLLRSVTVENYTAEQIDKIVSLLEETKLDLFNPLLWKKLSASTTLGSLDLEVKKDGRAWPLNEKLVPADELLPFIKEILRAAYRFWPKSDSSKINWLGLMPSDQIFSQTILPPPILEESSAGLRHDPLDQILLLGFMAAVEQGLRTQVEKAGNQPVAEYVSTQIGLAVGLLKGFSQSTNPNLRKSIAQYRIENALAIIDGNFQLSLPEDLEHAEGQLIIQDLIKVNGKKKILDLCNDVVKALTLPPGENPPTVLPSPSRPKLLE